MNVCGRQDGCLPGLYVLQADVSITVLVQWPPTYLLYSVEQKPHLRALQGLYQLLPGTEPWRHAHWLLLPGPCVLSTMLQSLWSHSSQLE